jgi:hypothetical protein
MKLKSVDKKVVNDVVQMARPTVLFAEIEGQAYTEHYVAAHEVCRADLISLKRYGTDAMSDIILKFNRISNPFSFNEGDIILIPDRNIALIQWKEIVGFDIPELNQIKAQFLETKRLTEKDAKRVEYLKKKADKKANGSTVPAPPNILKPGDSNIVISGGKISLNPSAFAKFKDKKAAKEAAKAAAAAAKRKEELRTRTSRRDESPG